MGRLLTSVLVLGPEGAENWDRATREERAKTAIRFIGVLSEAGATGFVLGGSFVENVAHPNDVDLRILLDIGSFAAGEFQRQWHAVDPELYQEWTNDAVEVTASPRRRKPLVWHKYRIDVLTDFRGPSMGDREEERLLRFLQHTRAREDKGVVEILP